MVGGVHSDSNETKGRPSQKIPSINQYPLIISYKYSISQAPIQIIHMPNNLCVKYVCAPGQSNDCSLYPKHSTALQKAASVSLENSPQWRLWRAAGRDLWRPRLESH